MLVCIAFHQGDVSLASNLISWISELGGCPEHNLCLVADASIQWNVGMDMVKLGNKAFKNTGLITTKEPITGWPKGANALWKLAAEHCKKSQTPFLWMEPDAVPMRPTWLTELQKAYNNRTKPFMGRIYSSDSPDTPKRLMSGIAIYPHDAIDILSGVADSDKAWDMVMADKVVPLCENTRLIHHFWGMPNLAPTFAAVRTQHSPINTFTLNEDDKLKVDPLAAVFHRTKDGSLINLLRNKHFPEVIKPKTRTFDVVFPFCATDADLAYHNIQWMAELNDHYPYTMILAIDDQSRFVHEIRQIAQSIFAQAIIFKYPLPPVPGHPQAANWAFKHTARYMQERGHPWLWMEPDMIPLKPEWLDVLQDEYERCGMDCMGPVVVDLNWLNGTSVYPANLADTCPNLMNMPDGHWAFDTVIHPEITHRTHNAAHLMYHCWVQMNDMLLPYGSGQLPEFHNKRMLSQIPESAVTFHRIKNTSLIERLRDQRQHA